MKRKIVTAILSTMLVLTACGQTDAAGADITADSRTEEEAETTEATLVTLSPLASENSSTGSEVFDEIDSGTLFTDRDQRQEADLTEAEFITVADGENITISQEGVYVLSGQANNVTINVEADSKDKVQLVLDGLKLTNTDQPCIYVKSADKVFVTLSGGNTLTVKEAFTVDGDTNTDAVIFSKDDLVLNGTGRLTIESSDNGITSKDGIKVTGGTLSISCEGSAIEAHEEILVADGNITVDRCNDGLHAEDNDDDTIGYIYIGGGTIDITATDDAIHATTLVKIDDGMLNLVAAEAIEGTSIQINGGTLNITASDDGINAAQKSSAYSPLFEMNGGTVNIEMGVGDTDGVDSNGDIIMNGGTISVNGYSTFDYDGTAEHNGGTIYVNGEETDEIPNQFMGGFPGGFGGHGGFNGQAGSEGQMPDRPDGTGWQENGGFQERPEWGNGQEMPEGFTAPEGVEPPEGFSPPEGFDGNGRPQQPEGQEPPQGFNSQGRHGMGNRENAPGGGTRQDMVPPEKHE